MKIADILVQSKLLPLLIARKRTVVGEFPTAKNSRTVRNSSAEYSRVAALWRAIEWHYVKKKYKLNVNFFAE